MVAHIHTALGEQLRRRPVANPRAGASPKAKSKPIAAKPRSLVQRVYNTIDSELTKLEKQKGFTAQLRGLAHYLQQPKGRLLQLTCDADLGDARCTVHLSSPAFHGEGAITAAHSARRFTVSGIDGFENGFFWLLTFLI